MRTFFLIAFLCCLFSCEQKENNEPLKKLILETTFDTGVIQNLYLYDSLRNIIISHIDTIFKFKNERNFVTNEKGSHIQEDAYEYRFNYYPEGVKRIHGTVKEAREIDPFSLEKMPAYIYPSVESIFKKIGNNRINGFRIYLDSSIVIDIRDDYNNEGQEYIRHILKWDRFYKNDTDVENLICDTLLAPKWVYSILIERN